jgi:nucleoid DNA-binding protein
MSTEKKKPLSKTEILTNLAEATGLAKKDVSKLFDAMSDEIQKSLAADGPGSFTIPGLIKIERKDVPAKAEKKNQPNPFKPGTFHDVPAKPASVKVKVRALKSLKDLAK